MEGNWIELVYYGITPYSSRRLTRASYATQNEDAHYTCLFCRYTAVPKWRPFVLLRVFFWNRPTGRGRYFLIGICPVCGDIRGLGKHKLEVP